MVVAPAVWAFGESGSVAVAMVERPRVGARPGVNYVEAVAYLREFLGQRKTPTWRLRRLDRRGDPDGAYPQSAADGLPPAPRHEMAGNFTAKAEERADRGRTAQLSPFPDWCWCGWEDEILRLPYIENRAVTLLLVERYSLNAACDAVGKGDKTMRAALSSGLRTLAVNLLAVNPPPAR